MGHGPRLGHKSEKTMLHSNNFVAQRLLFHSLGNLTDVVQSLDDF